MPSDSNPTERVGGKKRKPAKLQNYERARWMAPSGVTTDVFSKAMRAFIDMSTPPNLGIETLRNRAAPLEQTV